MRAPRARSGGIWMLAPILVFVALAAGECIAISRLDHGSFSYTLDDPYLHLALAENLAHGHYGLNREDFAAPCSSIAWPFLLAPFAGGAAGPLVPLAINLLCSIGTLLLLGRIADRALAGLAEERRATIAAIVAVFMMLATNMVGLAFTGMEHSLQVLLSIALLEGLIREGRDGAMPGWLPLVCVLGPLVRYENLALSLPALVLLAMRGHARAALAAGLALAALLAGFSLMLHSIGQGWLPSSVLAKSAVVSSGLRPGAILHNLRANVRPGCFLLVLVALFAAVCWRSREEADRGIAAWSGSVMLLHLAFGRFGWFARYEIYAWATGLAALVHLYGGSIGRWSLRPPRFAALAALVLALTSARYLSATARTPLASNNVYEQQAQMHRFAADLYRAPVAANDLGWVSYRNDRYVLDLEGLSSRETHEARRGAIGNEWMDRSCARHGVHLAMIYASVIEPPRAWVRLGDLRLSRPNVSLADSVVQFWATDAGTARTASAPLAEFARTLPRGVRFDRAAIEDSARAR